MTSGYRDDPVLFLLHRKCPIIKKQGNISFSLQPFHFFMIFIIACRLCITLLDGTELFLQPPQFRIFSDLDSSSQMNTNLGTIVSTDYRAIIDKCDFTAQAGGRYCCTHTCNTCTYNY